MKLLGVVFCAGLLEADLALRCNRSDAAVIREDSCRRNSDGLYCGLAVTYVNEVFNIEVNCTTALTSGCAAECRNLLMLIRNELGCCINLFWNSTSSGIFRPGAFNNSLWTTCGVAPVTETCSSSPISLDTTTDIDSNCDFAEEEIELRCTRRFLEPIFNALEDVDNCQVYLAAVMERCGVNEEGERCALQLTLVDQFSQTQAACSLTNAICTEGCTQALEGFSDVGGCCVNNLFNGSQTDVIAKRFDFLSFEFWSNCGMDTLGTCEVRFNDATTQRISVVTPSNAPSNGATAPSDGAVTPSDGAVTPSDGATTLHIGNILMLFMGFLLALYYC